jgi:hypothetical protein
MSDWPLNKECFVTSITLAALKKFGLESLEWEPEILRDAFEEQFDLAKLSQKAFDKLNCGYMLLGTDLFYSSIEGFLSATAVMNDRPFEEDQIPFCSLEECAWSVWEASQLTGETSDGKPTTEFHPDIVKYIQEAGRLNGVSKFPLWLSFANTEDAPYPDMSGDESVFEMYMQRQQECIADLNRYVQGRQDKLTEELQKLEKLRLVG